MLVIQRVRKELLVEMHRKRCQEVAALMSAKQTRKSLYVDGSQISQLCLFSKSQ
jgi:hypothetical protein